MRVGIEATGSMQWFLNLMEELGIEGLVGHPAETRAAEPQKQKHGPYWSKSASGDLVTYDRTDTSANPLRHRHQWVCLRVKIQNALQAIALANGLRRQFDVPRNGQLETKVHLLAPECCT